MIMKKILIVNNNMKVGGVQKSLYNLLWEIRGRYEVTLCLFSGRGAYLEQLPPEVQVIECDSLFRYLGISQGECSGIHKLKRGTLAFFCRIFGRTAVMKLLIASQKMLPEEYDCAIAFLQNGRKKNFYGGVQEFVLRRVKAQRKVAFLHCDYGNCGANHPDNNRLLAEFDRIAACSHGCRRAFEAVLPELASKCRTVRNCHRFDEIQNLAAQEPVCYDADRINLITVARLAHEKGIERAIAAAAKVRDAGLPVTLHLVGSGAMEERLRELTRELEMTEQVVFHGEQPNPYRYMANADLFLLTSYHEAAPMVIEEAISLGLPVLTVRTTSSDEMVTQQDAGWVCENTQAALDACLMDILRDPVGIEQVKTGLRQRSADNQTAAEQFRSLIEG